MQGLLDLHAQVTIKQLEFCYISQDYVTSVYHIVQRRLCKYVLQAEGQCVIFKKPILTHLAHRLAAYAENLSHLPICFCHVPPAIT